MANQLIDETGNKYGTLTVISLTKDHNNRTAWLCQCDCGNQKIARGSDLRKGRITSCGCKKGKHPNNIRDITHKKFGMLTAIKYEYSKNNKQYWSFQCDCGNTVIKHKGAVIHGDICSCGCSSSRLKSEKLRAEIPIGQVFGLQKVIADATDWTKDSITKVLCECEKCHTQKVFRLADLKSGNTYSCICCNSYPEYIIKELLQEKSINYSLQQTMPGLISKNNSSLRFDFGIKDENNNIIGLIEYNGEQHYRLWEYDRSKQDFIDRQDRDKLKIDYCKKYSIPLLILTKDSDKEKEINNFIQQIMR